MTEETNVPAVPEIVRKPEDDKWYIRFGSEEYGPWENLDNEIQLSPDRTHWAITGEQRNNYYVLADGCQYGPFFPGIIGPWFDPGRGTFVFSAQRDNEFFLVAGGEIIKEGKIVKKSIGNEYLAVNRKKFGPYESVWRPQFSLSGKKWAASVDRDGQSYLLLNGKEHGPFRDVSRIEFSEVDNVCTCHCTTDQGKWLLIGGEQLFGPYKSIHGPYFSPDGKHWGLDIERKKWNGFLVDGIEFGPFPHQEFFCPEFNQNSNHWVVTLDSGYDGSPHSFILDGIKHGPFKILGSGFMADGNYFCYYRLRGKYFFWINGRRIGPYCYKGKELILRDHAVLADMTFVNKGKKSIRRCVVHCPIEDSEKRIHFGPQSGETLQEAIEIIHATDTKEGVFAEHEYLRLKYASLGIAYRVFKQELIPCGEKRYDRLIVELENGQQESYFFDITSFFGKSGPETDSKGQPDSP